MRSLNRHTLIGHVGALPVVRETSSGQKVANLRIATNSSYKDKDGEVQETTEWHNAVAWGKLAEIVEEYVKKGTYLMVEGPSQTRSWEGDDEVTRYTTQVNVRELIMLGTSPKGKGKGKKAAKNKVADEDLVGTPGGDDPDEELPF